MICYNSCGGIPYLCEYLEHEESPFTLPLQKEIKVSNSFEIILPNDIPSGTYITNIKATSDAGGFGVITVEVNVGNLGILSEIFTKLGSSKIIGGVTIPYFLFVLGTFILIGVGGFIALRKTKVAAISFVVAFLVSPIILLFI